MKFLPTILAALAIAFSPLAGAQAVKADVDAKARADVKPKKQAKVKAKAKVDADAKRDANARAASGGSARVKP